MLKIAFKMIYLKSFYYKHFLGKMLRLPFSEIIYNVDKSNLLQSKKETHTTQYSNKHYVKEPFNIFWTTA